MSSKTLVMLGAGGHAKVCYEIACLMKRWEKIIILDDDTNNDFFEVSGKLADKDKYSTADFFVAIGSNSLRRKLFRELLEKDYKIATLTHPSAIISSEVEIGKGTVVMAGAIISINSVIGESCILNTKISIDHDNKIGDFVHLSPGVTLSGNTEVSNNTWIGMGANIINNISISSDCVIGAGSLVIRDITESGLYIGVPARLINK